MTSENKDKSKYYLFIDECGDQNLENYNPSFPAFDVIKPNIYSSHGAMLGFKVIPH